MLLLSVPSYCIYGKKKTWCFFFYQYTGYIVCKPYVYICMYYMYACMCVCVCERERQGERARESERESSGGKEMERQDE